MSALAGIRVVEFGGDVSAAYASKLLADLGADVVKVETSEGDPLRQAGPWAPGERQHLTPGGGLFRYLNGAKRSAVAGHDQRLVLAATADLIIENLGPGRMEAAGLSVTQLVEHGFVGALVRISDFGQDGPYRDVPASGLVVQAMGGWVSSHGLPDRDPVQVGGRLSEFAAASFAACAALTATRAASELGRCITVDVSVMECLVGTLAYPMLFHLTLAGLGLPPPESRFSVLPGIVRCADGWAGINALTGQHWQDICVMLGAEHFSGAQRDLGWGGSELDRFYREVQPMLDAHTVEEIVELSQAFRIPAAPVGTGETLTRLAQFRERPFFVREVRAEGEGAVMPGAPYRLGPTLSMPASAAPSLGGDTQAVVTEATTRLVRRDRANKPEPKTNDDPYRPFGGLRVIDLGTFWAGPYVGLYLGSMGADVIKVESAHRPDGFRFSAAFPQEGDDWYERSGLWQATNLNKRGIAIDVSQPEGLDLLRRLIGDADVVIENFSPRVIEQFGLGYDTIRALNPAVVMVRMPGFGLEGPWRDYVGWAMSFEQTSGMAQVTGDGIRPINPGGFLDPVVGMHAAVAIQAALEHRRRTGEGQFIEVAQVETGVCLTAEQVIAWSLNGEVLAGEGNRSRTFAPQGVYRCAVGRSAAGGPGAEAGDDRRRPWVALSVRNDMEWATLVDALGRPPWATPPRFSSVDERRAAHDALDAGIASWTSIRSPAEVVGALRPRGLAVAALLTAPDMYDDPQLVARGYYEAVDHPITGRRRYPGWPMRFSFAPAGVHRRPAPTLGQHNDEVLGGELHLRRERLETLRRDGVIGERMEP